MGSTRRSFLQGSGRLGAALMTLPVWGTRRALAEGSPEAMAGTALDRQRIRALAAWTAKSMETASPVPFGAEIIHTVTGESLMRALNAVSEDKDPSSHAEVRTMRLACAKLNSPSLAGYTLYTTCEPCPMCMSDALWAGLDRVVYGATIADANRFVKQIRIPATEVVKRSDMVCEVVGPVEHAACVALFTDPRMQEVFKRWAAKK